MKTSGVRCFKCDDGYTPLYCLNCAREGYVPKAELDAALQGRLGDMENAPLFACQEYVRAEDCLPDRFDTEDYCLSNAVATIVKELGDVKAVVAQLVETLDLAQDNLGEIAAHGSCECTEISQCVVCQCAHAQTVAKKAIAAAKEVL